MLEMTEAIVFCICLTIIALVAMLSGRNREEASQSKSGECLLLGES
jgi:hypothetical protein